MRQRRRRHKKQIALPNQDAFTHLFFFHSRFFVTPLFRDWIYQWFGCHHDRWLVVCCCWCCSSKCWQWWIARRVSVLNWLGFKRNVRRAIRKKSTVDQPKETAIDRNRKVIESAAKVSLKKSFVRSFRSFFRIRLQSRQQNFEGKRMKLHAMLSFFSWNSMWKEWKWSN